MFHERFLRIGRPRFVPECSKRIENAFCTDQIECVASFSIGSLSFVRRIGTNSPAQCHHKLFVLLILILSPVCFPLLHLGQVIADGRNYDAGSGSNDRNDNRGVDSNPIYSAFRQRL